MAGCTYWISFPMKTGQGRRLPRGFDLHMLRQTPAGDTYTAAQFKEIFSSAGLEVEAVTPLSGTPYTVVIAGHQ